MPDPVKTFMEYFTDHLDYPVCKGEILPIGTLWQYVSNTFLNGFINHQEIKKAFLLGRYESWDRRLENSVEIITKETSQYKNIIHCNTKDEIFHAAMSKDKAHTNFSELLDDVLILSVVGDEYWFYWFDKDVSDCMIGRFKTADNEDIIFGKLKEYISDRDTFNKYGEKEIPLQYFKGWIKG